MTHALRVFEPSDGAMWVAADRFDQDPGERLEALATAGRGPLRVAARVAVAVDARLGGWRRAPAGGPGVPLTVPPHCVLSPIAVPSPRSRSAAVLAETRAKMAARTDAPSPQTGPAPTDPAQAERPPGGPARDPGPATRPARRRRPLTAATVAGNATRAPAPTIDARRAASSRRVDRPLRCATRDRRGGAPRAAGARRGASATAAPGNQPAPFPAALDALADRRSAGVGDEDAWARWISSGPLDHLAQLTDGLDQAPGRAERAGANLRRAASRLRRTRAATPRPAAGA